MGEQLAFTFALTGRREWGYGTQDVALGWGLVGLSARVGPQIRLFPHNLHLLNFLNFERPTFHGLPVFPFDHSVEPVVRSQDFFIGEILERLGNFLFREAV